MPLDPYLAKLNKSALATLREEWHAERLTVVVGAGASVQAGLPTWYGVLDEMLFQYVENAHKKTRLRPLSDDIRKHMQVRLRGESPLIIAHYLRSQHTSEAAFLKLVHRALYRRLTGPPQPGPIAQAIASLANKNNGKLRSIITFNFDDLIESALNIAHVRNTPVWNAIHWSAVSGLAVYHPHGFLPFKMKTGERYWVVLSESDYHTQYATPHSWSNIAFTQALLESTCLFVSTSITDPNLRRMLDTMHQTTPDRYHYFVWETPEPGSFAGRPIEEIAHETFESVFVKSHERIGLKPVWFHYRGQDPTKKDPNHNWKDIPEILDAIANP